MWELETPQPAKLIVGILAADTGCLDAALAALTHAFGPLDLVSEVWPFSHTDYYRDQAGPTILRQFVTAERLVDPADLADIKHRTNAMERDLARQLVRPWPRPVNLDPGILEPAKLVLASTKNFSHRVYIGRNMYAEVTLTYVKGHWQALPFTFPDFREDRYYRFFDRARRQLIEQRRQTH